MRTRASEITLLAVVFALTALMAFVPYFGMITIPGLAAINLLLVPTAVAAVALGKYHGLAAGTFVGVLSLVLSYLQPVNPLRALFATYPYLALLPRIPVGFVMAVVYRRLRRVFKRETPAVVAGAAAGAVTNTALVALGVLLAFSFAPEVGAEAWAGVATYPLNLAAEVAALALITPPAVAGLRRAGLARGPAAEKPKNLSAADTSDGD